MTRMDRDEYFLRIADIVKERGTCVRRKVGCVLINKRHHIISTGYNGVAAGQVHCSDVLCGGELFNTGEGLEVCQAVHAESNAILQCREVYDIDTAYVTVSPCISCTKLFLNTSCQRIVFLSSYAQSGVALWSQTGRIWEQYSAAKDAGQ